MPPEMKTPTPGQEQAQSKVVSSHHNADVFTLLDRLDKVKKTGNGCWRACCPAHDDRSPSLSVRETEDGTILVKCWTGCGAADVVAAIGLSLADLFPQRERDDFRKTKAPGQRWIPRDVLAAVASEAVIAFLAADQVSRGIPLDDRDVDRVAVAAGRLMNAAREVGCYAKHG